MLVSVNCAIGMSVLVSMVVLMLMVVRMGSLVLVVVDLSLGALVWMGSFLMF